MGLRCVGCGVGMLVFGGGVAVVVWRLWCWVCGVWVTAWGGGVESGGGGVGIILLTFSRCRFCIKWPAYYARKYEVCC